MGLLNLSSVFTLLILSSIIIQHAASSPIFGLLAAKALLIKKLLLKKGKGEGENFSRLMVNIKVVNYIILLFSFTWWPVVQAVNQAVSQPTERWRDFLWEVSEEEGTYIL